MSDWSLSLFEQSNSLHLPHSCPFHCIITNLAGGSICLYWEHEAAFVHLTVTFAAGRGREGDKMYSQKGRDSCLNKLQIHLAPHCCFKGAVWMGHWNLSSKDENCKNSSGNFFSSFFFIFLSHFSPLGCGKGKALAISLLCILGVTHSAI